MILPPILDDRGDKLPGSILPKAQSEVKLPGMFDVKLLKAIISVSELNISMEIPHYIQQNTPLANLTTLKIGGNARFFTEITNIETLTNAVKWSQANQVKLLVLGGGSNVVISDNGFAGLVIKMNIKGVETSVKGVVKAAAGELWDDLVECAVEKNLQGLECLSGIPGTVGAAPIQNIGAYGQEVKNTIIKVCALNIRTLQIEEFNNEACKFTYRNSIFKQENSDYIVTEVTFKLTPHGTPKLTYQDLAVLASNSPTLPEVRREIIRIRKSKGMMLDENDPNTCSVGSFFTNPVIGFEEYERLKELFPQIPGFPTETGIKVPAAWLIENAGFYKGYSFGNVGISTKHALALINKGNANAREIYEAAETIKKVVSDKFGIILYLEPKILP